MNMAQKKEHDDNRNAQKQLGDALLAFHQAQTEKMKSSTRESAAPRCEQDLLEVFTEYKSSRLKETRLELDTAKQNMATYNSDDSDVVNLKREIALCKKKLDEIFALFSESDLK
jgi:hypothetical protein